MVYSNNFIIKIKKTIVIIFCAKTLFLILQRSGSRSTSPRRMRNAEGAMRSRSRSRSRKSRERKERPSKEGYQRVKDTYARFRSRSGSRGRRPGKSSKYSGAAHRSNSRSRSRSPFRNEKRYSRSRSRSYSRSRDRERGFGGRSQSRSPMSSRKRHVGNRDNPVPSRCLGIFGLSIYTTETQIYHIFSKFGPVERVQVVIDAKVINCFVFFL